MFRVEAPTVPAPVEDENGDVKRQHSNAELPFLVTMAVSSRKVPLVAATVASSASAEAAVAATSGARKLEKRIWMVGDGMWTLEKEGAPWICRVSAAYAQVYSRSSQARQSCNFRLIAHVWGFSLPRTFIRSHANQPRHSTRTGLILYRPQPHRH